MTAPSARSVSCHEGTLGRAIIVSLCFDASFLVTFGIGIEKKDCNILYTRKITLYTFILSLFSSASIKYDRDCDADAENTVTYNI